MEGNREEPRSRHEEHLKWALDWHRQRRRRRAGGPGLVFGAAIIAVGMLLLLDNLGILHFRDAFAYWPTILIAVGIARLLDSRGPASVVWGGLLTGAGTLLLLNTLNIFRFDFALLWPVFVIGVGAVMLFRAVERRRYPDDPITTTAQPLFNPNSSNWTVFGGIERRIDSPDFRGTEAFAIFGGVKLDLRHAKIQVDQAVVDINATFGGIEVMVPDDWIVVVQGTGIFGGFEDKTLPPRRVEGEKPQRLLVTGYAVFGGATISN